MGAGLNPGDYFPKKKINIAAKVTTKTFLFMLSIYYGLERFVVDDSYIRVIVLFFSSPYSRIS